jgi:hypothetical protein
MTRAGDASEGQAEPSRAVTVVRTLLQVVGWLEVVQVVGSLVFWGRDSLLMGIGAMIVPALVAIGCFIGARRLRSGAGNGIFATGLRYAVGFGAVGFAAGFFGPMIFAPDANQGPMLGIFITGPAGVVIGFLIGALQSSGRQPRPGSAASAANEGGAPTSKS